MKQSTHWRHHSFQIVKYTNHDQRIFPGFKSEDLGLHLDLVESMTDVHGKTSETPLSYGYATLENKSLPIKILVSPGPELAGIGLFTKFGYKVSVDCKNKKVELRKMR